MNNSTNNKRKKLKIAKNDGVDLSKLTKKQKTTDISKERSKK